MDELLLFAYGAFGAALLEIIHWYKRREVILHSGIKEYRKGLVFYLLIVSAFILASGILAVVYFEGREGFAAFNVVIFGASVPSFIKIGGKPGDHLGSSKRNEFFDSIRRGYTA
ncbi:hypothetical protein [Thalassomonas haliotis]|uniref:Uncharacterized protein n=1 Tax=Thalassomonas haliotis TaxID=485448 RepID=A0ABY7VBN2_9GAMM|nr:hypothetical protein [Thalassomonas haliotis]WDE11042.1 hypothetical protein H3N35_22835 [Thalassomonas haliotis]